MIDSTIIAPHVYHLETLIMNALDWSKRVFCQHCYGSGFYRKGAPYKLDPCHACKASGLNTEFRS